MQRFLPVDDSDEPTVVPQHVARPVVAVQQRRMRWPTRGAPRSAQHVANLGGAQRCIRIRTVALMDEARHVSQAAMRGRCRQTACGGSERAASASCRIESGPIAFAKSGAPSMYSMTQERRAERLARFATAGTQPAPADPDAVNDCNSANSLATARGFSYSAPSGCRNTTRRRSSPTAYSSTVILLEIPPLSGHVRRNAARGSSIRTTCVSSTRRHSCVKPAARQQQRLQPLVVDAIALLHGRPLPCASHRARATPDREHRRSSRCDAYARPR